MIKLATGMAISIPISKLILYVGSKPRKSTKTVWMCKESGISAPILTSSESTDWVCKKLANIMVTALASRSLRLKIPTLNNV
jgi:hypothetical protein